MAEIVEKAKIEGDSWNERQWEKAITDFFVQGKSLMLEAQTLKEEVDAATTEEEQQAINEKVFQWGIEHSLECEQINAFDSIIENNATAQSLVNDEEFIEKLSQEIGVNVFE